MKKTGKCGMRILSLAAALIDVLCFVLSVYAFATGQTQGALKALIVAVLFATVSVLLFKGGKLPKGTRPQENEDRPANSESRYDYLHFTVAGVTFQNEDGRHRQTILRRMRFGEAPYDNGYSASLEEYEFQGKLAVGVLVNGDMIGNVPREAVQAVLSFMDRPGCCVSHIDVYGGGRKKGSSESLNYGAEVTLRCNK